VAYAGGCGEAMKRGVHEKGLRAVSNQGFKTHQTKLDVCSEPSADAIPGFPPLPARPFKC
jgi:hypothetical protein